jgi:RING finger protein 121
MWRFFMAVCVSFTHYTLASRCAYCSEKVDMKKFMVTPWESHSLTWGFILDGIRYLIVFNPLIFLTAQFMLYIMY